MLTLSEEAQLIDETNHLRVNILKMIFLAGSGHPGGSLSAIDVLTVLYKKVMKHDPSDPKWKQRDRFVLSKGHCCPALYAILADCGYFPEEHLWTLRKFGSILQGHPFIAKTPGIDVSSGSLGQGLSIAAGMALGFKADRVNNRVYCMCGDGELQEGSIWEAAMAAGHFNLDNLCCVIDHNGLQIDGNVEAVMGIEPLRDKWEAYRWNVININGHVIPEIYQAFDTAKNYPGKPTVIIAHTIKGKGVSFMENQASWHGIAPDKHQLELAIEELAQKTRCNYD